MSLPDQPSFLDATGVRRFVENPIVVALLDDEHRMDLNDVARATARGRFSREAYAQFMQLLGYSVSGFGDLSLVPDEIKDRCDRAAEAAEAPPP